MPKSFSQKKTISEKYISTKKVETYFPPLVQTLSYCLFINHLYEIPLWIKTKQLPEDKISKYFPVFFPTRSPGIFLFFYFLFHNKTKRGRRKKRYLPSLNKKREIFLELKKKRKARGNKGVTSLFFKLLKDGENQEKGSAEDHVRLRILVGRFGFHPTGQCKSEGQQSDTAHEHRNDQGDLPSVRQNGSDARGKPRGGKG